MLQRNWMECKILPPLYYAESGFYQRIAQLLYTEDRAHLNVSAVISLTTLRSIHCWVTEDNGITNQQIEKTVLLFKKQASQTRSYEGKEQQWQHHAICLNRCSILHAQNLYRPSRGNQKERRGSVHTDRNGK